MPDICQRIVFLCCYLQKPYYVNSYYNSVHSSIYSILVWKKRCSMFTFITSITNLHLPHTPQTPSFHTHFGAPLASWTVGALRVGVLGPVSPLYKPHTTSTTTTRTCTTTAQGHWDTPHREQTEGRTEGEG